MTLPWPALADVPLHEMSLEDLMQVEVTSVSKKKQTLAQTAAAAYVIKAEDIRRSGARSIPEALRLAPGVQVAAIGNNKWAVSIRGQADRFTNKLLVLVDGVSVYSPMFSGVVWEALDLPLENIERIEVVRGPGAATWGANAVNGVISIITRSAFGSLGGEVALAAGIAPRASGFGSYGWSPAPDTAIRLYAKSQVTEPSRRVDGGRFVDAWRTRSAGLRLDHLSGNQTFQLQGNVYASRAGDELIFPTAAGFGPVAAVQHMDGGYLLGNWEASRANGGSDSFQAYLQHVDYRHVVLTDRLTTLDLEYRAQRRPAPAHEVSWGLGLRYDRDTAASSALVTLAPRRAGNALYSAFLQDEIVLQPGRWLLSLGARLEHNDYTGFEFQPNARLMWTPDARTSLWLSAARASRTPARVERNSVVRLPLSAASVLEMNNRDMASERLDALDIGLRHQFSSRLSADLAAFRYRYSRLRDAVIVAAPQVLPPGVLVLSSANTSSNGGDAWGLEASVDWKPRPELRLQAAYSFFDSRIHLAPQRLSSGYADTTPAHMLSLRASLESAAGLQWDAWLRYVGKVMPGNDYTIPAYTELDLRVAWQARPDLELSLVGQNLLAPSHREFGSSYILSTPAEIERGVYLRADWKF